MGLSLWSLYVGAVTVWTATVTANLVISNAPTYPVPQLPLDATTLTVAALTGTAAFLGISMNAPLSALTLLIGFTGQGASA